MISYIFNINNKYVDYMRKIVRKKHLEMELQKIPSHPNPKVEFEQYSTPAVIAADLLWNAFSLGDVSGKNILDLGCGCGIFGIGASLLDANSVVGVDIDEDSIEIARKISSDFGISDIAFECCDINGFDGDYSADTIFQNPPFGSQMMSDDGADLDFVLKSFDLHPDVLYSFHMASTRDFLLGFYDEVGFTITHLFEYDFPIPKIYDFHKNDSKNVGVIVIRAVI